MRNALLVFLGCLALCAIFSQMPAAEAESNPISGNYYIGVRNNFSYDEPPAFPGTLPVWFTYALPVIFACGTGVTVLALYLAGAFPQLREGLRLQAASTRFWNLRGNPAENLCDQTLNILYMSNAGGIEEVLVPCPKCGKLHKVSAQDAKEHERVSMPCGAVIGSIGVLRRISDAEERAKSLQSKLHKLG